jgi:two-component system, cell cycle sensor histidine kinase and response regulator CckA
MEGPMNANPAMDRDRRDDDLRESEARYRRLFETAQDGILILNAQSGLIVDVNPYLINLLDYRREEFIGKALWDIGPFKNIEASKTAFRELQDRQYIRYDDLPLEAKGGRRINVEFVSNVYGVNGTNVIQCNIRDITARKRAERMDEGVRQSQKMEAVGQLAGGLAHDFNNLLGVILGYCDLLEPLLGPEDSKRRMIEHIHNAGMRAAALTRQLLAFSRRQVLRPVVLDLNTLVIRMQTMLRRLIGEHIEIGSILSPDLGHIKADPTQIEQILMNLAVNARDAMPSGGKITIETANVELDENFARMHAEVIAGLYVMLSVSDTGLGMDGETKTRIFEPFFTTKPLGKGTGLGLSTVYGIVKQSSGYIYAFSEPDKGTAFKVYLPYVIEELDLIRHEDTSSVRGGSETILLVEDNALLRELAREMLEGLGYTVLDSGRPYEAIRIAQQHGGVISLLITDVVMPGLNGRVLAETLRTVRQDMKVLYISGYTDDASVEGELEAGCPLLDKPFTRDTLAKRIRELLDPMIS